MEPRPENFGLRYINEKQYELTKLEKPLLSNYQLTDDDFKKIDSTKFKRVIYIFSFLTILITFLLILKVNLITFVLDIYNEEGLWETILQLFLWILFFGIVYLFLIAAAAYPVSNLIYKYLIKFLNATSPKRMRYLEYSYSLDKYEKEMEIAINNFETAKNNYIQEELRKQISFWKSLSGRKFEIEMELLFQKQGYDTQLTPASNDHGIDIILRKGKKKIIVQCKQHSKPVGPHVVRDLYGALVESKANEAILVCTSGFTSGVYKFVKGKQIILMDIEDIIQITNNINPN